ncbi:MAG: TolC family protein [Sphingobacteriales bacterium]
MKHIILIVSLMCAAALNGFAQQAPPDSQKYNFTVADCVNYAYEHQHDVKNANLDVESAGYHVKEIVGQGYPQINASAAFQDYLKSQVVLFPNIPKELLQGLISQGVKDGNGNTITMPLKIGRDPVSVSFSQKYNSNLGLNLSQIIFDPSYLVGLQGRKTYKQLYERSFTRSKIEANVNVTKAYYQVLVSVEQLKLLEANINELKQQLDETSARNKQGFVEKIDVDRLTVQYNSLNTTRENTIRLLALNYELLKFQMGMPIEKQLTLKDKLEDVHIDAGMAEAVNDTTVYRDRIEYGLLETQNKLQQYDLKLKKGQFLPKLTANANLSDAYQNNSFSQLFTTQYPTSYIGLNLSVPIFTGWQHLNQFKQSHINLLKSQNDMYDMKNTINLQVSVARTSFINGLQSLNDQKKNMALAGEVLRVAKIKYEQGVGSSIEVTQAETDVQQADNSYIQGLYDALVSKVDLDKAYGRIK